MTERRTGKPEARMEAWQLIRTRAPSWHLLGLVFGHARFVDARVVLTSDLIDLRADAVLGIRVETLNTIYRLGESWVGELPEEYREVLGELLGEDWRAVPVEELADG